MIQISRFEVDAIKHPTDASATELVWKVLVKVRFTSDDPREWGEFRAYGGSWTRVINRTHAPSDMYGGAPAHDPRLRSQPRREESHVQLETGTHLPFWGLTQGPSKQNGLAWRLANDQHLEILYAKVVPGVPRSNPDSNEKLFDDDNEPDNPQRIESPGDFAGLDSEWHIIARDEPMAASFQAGDFVEYWHRAEFQIRDPQTGQVLPQKKQLFLRVTGQYPAFVYHKRFDSTEDDLPPSWETRISTPDLPGLDHYPERGIYRRR